MSTHLKSESDSETKINVTGRKKLSDRNFRIRCFFCPRFTPLISPLRVNFSRYAPVIPAEAGIRCVPDENTDSCFRRNDSGTPDLRAAA
jgi:hypothetical protein